MNKTLKTVLIVGGTIIGLLVFIPLISGLVSGWGYGGWGMMGPGMMGIFGGMGLMSLIWIVVLGLIIWAVVGAVRQPAEASGSTDSAFDVLNRRYVIGEINKEEYEDKKKDLKR